MIHNVLITNLSGNILLTRYYYNTTAPSEEEKLQWEGTIHRLTHHDWNNAKNEKHLVAVYQDRFIVYCGIGDLLIFWTGSGEYDELTLSEMLSSFIVVLKQICKNGVSEANLLECYSKVLLCLDEMVNKGILDQIDPFHIKNHMDMKPEQLKKK